MTNVSKQKDIQEEQRVRLGIEPDEMDELNKKTSGKILGFDYGTKRVGVAISDSGQSQAFVYDTLKMDNNFFDNIKQICKKELIDKIVVGLPLGMSGQYTEKTDEVISFVEELEERVKVIAVVQDERLSSVEADKTGSGSGRDEESARIILQGYLDGRNELGIRN